MRFSSVVLPAAIALAANVNAAPLHVTRSTEIEARGGTIFRGVPREIDAREPEPADIDSLLELVSREPEPAVALNLALPELDARGGVPPLGSILKALLNVFKAKRDLDSRAEPTDEDIAKMLVAAAMLQGRDLDELEARGGVPGLSSILSALKNIFRGVPRELGARAEPTDEDIAQLLVAAAMLQGRDVEELDARGGVPALGSILSALKNIFRGVPRELGARAEPTDEDIAKLLVVAMLQGRDVEELDARGGVPALGSILSALKNIFRGVPRELGARAEPTDEDIAKLLVAAMLQGRDIEELDARGGVPALGSILSALKNIFRGVPRDLDARGGVPALGSILSALKNIFRGVPRDLDARGGVPPLGSILKALLNVFKAKRDGVAPTEEEIAQMLIAAM
ncbi:hypothetical protein DL96DRAFT_1588556 [Flagelloscypha sp. PMI_526]|nr:hypothetical protein DL96DRAFT_1588556 [Flagelloscypha sp. PMI_526]